MRELTTMALCPTRAKTADSMAAMGRVTIEWRPTASTAMRAISAPYGAGRMVTWSVGVSLVKPDGRPATGTDAAATVQIAVALDASGRWQAKLSPGQNEGKRPLILEGEEGGYLAAQAAVAANMAEYVCNSVGVARGYKPVALRSTMGLKDLVNL